jgi:hypothetical protein
MKAMFFKGQCGPFMVCGERGLREGLGGLGIDLKLLGDGELSFGE